MRAGTRRLRAFKTRLYMRFRPLPRWRLLRDLLLLVAAFTFLTCYLSYIGSTSYQSQPSASSDGSRSAEVTGALKRSILSKLTSQEKSGSRTSSSAGPPTAVSIQLRLERLLEEIENQSLSILRQQRKMAVVRGMRNVVARDLPLYQRALEKHGFQVHSPPWYRKHHLVERNSTVYFVMDKPEIYRHSPEEEEPPDWQLLLCLAYSDGDPSSCFEWKEISDLKPYTRVNRLPGIKNVLWQRDSLCITTNLAKRLQSLKNQQPSPTCFVLPTQYQEFVNVAEALGYTSQWLLKPMTSSSPGPKMVDIFSPMGQNELDEYNRQRAVAQQLLTSPLTVFGQPISVRLYLLVTSLLPLRAYVHSQGIVYHRYNHSKNFKKIPGRTWPLSQLWRYVSKNYGTEAISEAISNIHQTLVHLLLLAELSIMTSSADDSFPGLGANQKFRCQHCFQLIGVDVILNTTLHASVAEVNGQPSVQESNRDEDFYINSVKEAVVQDTISLVLSTTPVARTVAGALMATQENMGISGLNCRVSHTLCLSHDDLLSLLGSRRESLSSNGFRMLYPSVHGEKYSPVVEEIQALVSEHANSIKTEVGLFPSYKTANLHNLMTKLENFYPVRSSDDSSEYGLKLPGCCRKTAENEQWPHDASFDNQEPFFPRCSDDPSTMPYLSGIFIRPTLKLTPTFSPLVTEYYANVSYDQLMVTLSARAQNCQTEVRIDDKYGPTRTTNYTLGVGENRINFLVVDITHTEPWVINNYSLLIHRLPITAAEQPFDPSVPHQVCSLQQECEMRVSPTELCGVQRDSKASGDWLTYMSEVAGLEICNHGDSPGRWVLPCRSCADRSTCYWREAVWHPFRCRHAILSTEQLTKCLASKKIMFIGDSTNRGMMHYVVERLNGTLSEWDKTHDIRVYNNVNNGSTSVSFAYYPQFWLPTNQRPVFDKALYHLIQKSRPLQNNTNTILVVGGVQWLATQHLLMMLRALRVERLQGIKLVMKTLGAGFHLPVEGVHTLSMDEQRKLLLHSMGLADFAKHYNFEVIDTFNITVPRYKDFLQGKCACHFHKVVKIPSTDENFPRWRTKPSGVTSRPARYHVEGPINAIYSEILLSRLCSDYITAR